MSYKTYTGSRIFITYIESDDRNTLSFYVAIIQLIDNEFERIIPNECSFQIDPSKTKLLKLLKILCVFKYRIYTSCSHTVILIITDLQ